MGCDVLDPVEHEDGCPDCGAPLGAQCSPDCPSAVALGSDPDAAWDIRGESVCFDKFMDRILEEESGPRESRTPYKSPIRALVRRQRERPHAHIRFGGR